MILLTVAAICHAGWNLLVKASHQQGPEFVWLYSAITAPVSLALLGWSIAHGMPAVLWWSGLVSMVAHTAYAVVLQKAYGAGEFATVYPVSRAVTPVLVTLAVSPWQGWPPPLAWCGVGLVLVGILVMDQVWAHRRIGRGSILGLAVAACSCAYTLWDGFAMVALDAPVLPYLAVGNVGQIAVLSVVLAPRRRHIRAIRMHWRRALPIAVLVPASYGLVLVAMSLEPLGTIAAGRTLNVVVGTLLAVLILREHLSAAKTIGLAIVVGGVLLIP